MRSEEVNLEQKDILDIVFAIIIGNGVLKISSKFYTIFSEFLISELITMILLFTTITFAILYWLETREFIREQNLIAKNTKVKFHLNIYTSRVFVLSTFALVIFSGIMIEYSNYANLKAYIIVNLLFWNSDYIGTLLHKRNNRKYSKYFRNECEYLKLSSWFLAHFNSNFFNFYGLINAIIYALLLTMYCLVDLTETIESILSIVMFFIILIRHFCWRISIYNRFQLKILRGIKRTRNANNKHIVDLV